MNVYTLEASKKKDELIVSKYSEVNSATLKVLDFLPCSVLVEDGRQILYFNSKLLEFLDIQYDETKSININIKIERKIRETSMKILSFKGKRLLLIV